MVLSRRTPWVLLLFTLFINRAGADPFQNPGEFIDSVLKRHPAVLKSRKLVHAAEFGVKGSTLQPNPIITLAATAGDAGESSNALTQNFEISGQPKLRFKQSTAELEAAQNQLRSARREVAALAYRSWLAYWQAHQLAELSVLRSGVFQEVSRAARRRYEVGEISQNESLRVELAAAQAEVALSNASADVESARRDLLLLSGESLDEATGELVEPRSILQDCTLETALAAVRRHPEIVSMELQQKALLFAAELVGKERGPTLGLSVYRSKLFRTAGVEQGAQLSLSFPLLDWGRIANRQREAEERAEAYAMSVEEAVLSRQQEVSRVWANLEAARRNTRLLETQASRYEELARESKIAYDLGLMSLTDALQTEASFRDARAELLEAQLEFYELELTLLERTGLPWPESLGPVEILEDTRE